MIKNQLGFHARPSAMIAKIAQKAIDMIWIVKEDQKVEASSIIDILTLACAEGECIKIEATNPDDLDKVNEIANLIEDGFGE
ncbi:MAG: HPr family phosphocarrier protein [Desulfobacterales bacterium]|nr:HPr family phosphocarrier protein [Desulfobacterales bacterium]MCP4158557.1 HPr family phosphocarrier protein [Deltaproteobacteria bacterium]